MSVCLRAFTLLLPTAALLSSGCIIVDDTDDDGATTVAQTSGATTSATSGATTSSTSDGESGSSGIVESGSSGGIDCSECNAGVEPDPLCHSSYDAALDACVCDAGFEFSDNDFECVPVDDPGGDCGDDPNIMVTPNGTCVCVEGWSFCTPDPDDFSCCEL